MGRFGSSFIGGYKKAEVDEYIEVLMDQLEQLKTRVDGMKAPDVGDIQALNSESDALKADKERLEGENAKLSSEVKELRAKLAEYEGSYESLSGVMSIARKEADELVSRAKEDASGIVDKAKNEADKLVVDAHRSAEKITTDAKVEALYSKKKAEEDINRQFEQKEQGIAMARTRVLEYVKAFNNAHAQIMELQKQLTLLAGRLPIYKEDIFSTEPLQIVEKPSEELTKPSIEDKQGAVVEEIHTEENTDGAGIIISDDEPVGSTTDGEEKRIR